MEPYTTCTGGYSFNAADSTLDSYLTTPINGNRNSLCESGTTAPINANLPEKSGSTNPHWAASSANGGETIGTCERACLNASATSASILDSLSNFGGNCMFRKFVYESFTTVYDAATTTGYATCGDGASSNIAWETNTYLTSPQIYQNYSGWMASYSAGSTSDPCVPATFCQMSNGAIPFTATSVNDKAACYQAATVAVADIMYALSYIASCNYIKTFAKLTAVQSSGACFDLGDGLVYLTAAQGLIGLGFFIVTVVGIMGYRRWQSDNYEENKQDKPDSNDEEAASKEKADEQDEQPQHAEPGASTEMNPVSTVGINPVNEPGGSGVNKPNAARDKWV